MNFIIYNILFSVIFSGAYFLCEKLNLVNGSILDMANMNYSLLCFLITLFLTTYILNKIKDYV